MGLLLVVALDRYGEENGNLVKNSAEHQTAATPRCLEAETPS